MHKLQAVLSPPARKTSNQPNLAFQEPPPDTIPGSFRNQAAKTALIQNPAPFGP